MPTTKSFGGQSFNLPLNREPKSSNWGTELSNFVICVADQAIPKTGGQQTLSAELNLGANYGLVAKYIKSVSSNLATTGVIRFANNEGIGWRNASNAADLVLKVDTNNLLSFNGVEIPNRTTTQQIADTKIAKVTSTDEAIVRFNGTTGEVQDYTATPATISDSGVVVIQNATDSSSKTNGSIVTYGGMGIGKKLFVGTSVHVDTVSELTNANGVAIDGLTIKAGTITASAYQTAGILHNAVTTGAVTSSLVVNADVDNSAAIAWSKLAAGATKNRILQTNSSTGIIEENSDTPNTGEFLKYDGSNFVWDTPAGAGDTVAPASQTTNAIARWSATAKTLKNTGITIDDSNNIASAGTIGCTSITCTNTKTGTLSCASDGTYLDSSGLLKIRTNGTTEAISIGTDQKVTLAQGIVGKTSAMGAGLVGEVLDPSVGQGVRNADGVFYDRASQAITAGVWLILATATFQRYGGTTATFVQAALSENSGNTTTDHVEGYNFVAGPAPTVAGADTQLKMHWIKTISSGATIYLKTKIASATGDAYTVGKLTAIRIA